MPFVVFTSFNYSKLLIISVAIPIAVNFTQYQYTFTEGQNGSICVKGNGRLDQSFKVDIQIVNDTAIGRDELSHIVYMCHSAL